MQLILAAAVLFGYLFLVAQYESWTMPVAILLSVIVALFGAVLTVGILVGVSLLENSFGFMRRGVHFKLAKRRGRQDKSSTVESQ